MHKTPRIVPAAILFFDCSRLLFLLTLLAAYMRPHEMIRGSGFPYMMCAAPNVLFPLMSFFLFIRLENFKAFIPLYITGKSLALLCMILWLFTSFIQINITGLERIVWAVFLGLADLGTIMGMAVLGTAIPTKTSSETVAETVSDVIIEEGGE